MLKTMGKYVALISLSLIAFLWSATATYAQCAMCKAVAEDSIDEAGYGIAMGLNTGILFIMSIPYILLTVGLIVFFKSQIRGFIKSFSNIH